MVSLRGIASAAVLEKFSNTRFPHQSPGQVDFWNKEKSWAVIANGKEGCGAHFGSASFWETIMWGRIFPTMASCRRSTVNSNYKLILPPYVLHQPGEDVKGLSGRLSLNNSRFTSHTNILDQWIAGKTVLPAILNARGDGHLLRQLQYCF